MNVISTKNVLAALQKHADARSWMDGWLQIAKIRHWSSLEDVRTDYPATDQVGGCLIFNVKGNTYRLIVGIRWAREGGDGVLFFKHLLTHAEYDKGNWKDDC